MKSIRRAITAITAASSLLMLGVMPLAAAEEEAAFSYIEEVIVTAEKREASVQDAPTAISAFDAAGIERENLDDVLDIQLAVPNLLFGQFNFGAPHLTIRGIGRSVVATSGDDPTAIVVNGAYWQAAPILEAEFYDVQRVEVLRGPQGTLYGRNSTGGVVSLFTQRPNDELTGSVEFLGGNYSQRKLKGAFNFPITDTFQVRLAGFGYNRDGYVTNTGSGSNNLDARDITSGRITFRFLSERTTADLILEYFNEDDERLRTSKQVCGTDTRRAPFTIGCAAGHKLVTFQGQSTQVQRLESSGLMEAALFGLSAFAAASAGTGHYDGYVSSREDQNGVTPPFSTDLRCPVNDAYA